MALLLYYRMTECLCVALTHSRRGRLFAEEIRVRHCVRVQLDVLRPDTGTDGASGRQVRAVHVVELWQPVLPEHRVVRVVHGLAVDRRRDQRGRDHRVPDDPRIRRCVHRLGRHQHQVPESERPAQSSQVRVFTCIGII